MALPRPHALADRLDRALAGRRTIDELARAVFATLRSAPPHAFACLATTDPATGLITGAWKSDELPLGDQEFAAAEYGAPDLNKFAEIARRQPPVGVLSVDTDGHPEQASRMRDYMTPQFGFADEIRLACLDRGTIWGALALYRREGEPYFTREEGGLLAAVNPAIAHHIQRILFTQRAVSSDQPDMSAVIIVDGQDRVANLTRAARSRIDQLGGWDHGALPASLVSIVSDARSHDRSSQTLAAPLPGHWLRLEANLLDDMEDDTKSVVVTITEASTAAVGQLTLTARGLTAREREVTQLVLRGASTKDIAATLHLSPHTVQDHLKAVFTKLGINSRRELVAALALP